MNNSTVNTTSKENSTTQSIHLTDGLDICVLCINLLFGPPTHIYIICLIARGTKSAIALEFFILNLSVCEIGNCLNSLFSLFTYSHYFLSIMALPEFFIGLAITGRPLFQCLICVERYLAVVHPLTFLKFKPLRYKVICGIAAWIICLVSCLVNMFYFLYKDHYSNLIFFLLQFLVFLSIQLFCCLAVLRALKQSGPGERGREEENHMKRRAFHLILITAVSMVFGYLPFTVAGFCGIMNHQYVEELFVVGFACFILAGFVQPFLYLHRFGILPWVCGSLLNLLL